MGKTEICNQALAFLRAQPIAAFDTDESQEGVLCRLFFPDVLQEVLESCDWSFATKRVRLTDVLVEAPTFEFKRAFSLPDDYLKLVEVQPEWASWRIENNLLLSNEAHMDILYVYDLKDTSRMQALFRRALSMKLAALLAVPLTGTRSFSEYAEEAFARALALAMNRDASESEPFVYRIGDFIDVRF